MENKPNFNCPHCGNTEWRTNKNKSCAIQSIIPKEPGKTGQLGQEYMEVMLFACSKCGYVVLFRIP